MQNIKRKSMLEEDTRTGRLIDLASRRLSGTPTPKRNRIQSSLWLEQKESNLHQRSQSPLPYHWAMPHSFRVIIITYIRRKVNKKDFVIMRFDYSSFTAFFARSYRREFTPFFCLLFIEFLHHPLKMRLLE